MDAIYRPENLFAGIRPERYEDGIRDFPALAEEAGTRASAMSDAEIEAGQRERTAQMIRLAELLMAGTPHDADAVQTEIHAQYRALSAVRAVTAAEFRAIGRSCVGDEEWRAAYDAITPGLPEYQRDAILTYSMNRLS